MQLPSTRKEASKIGSKFYFTGIPCKRGHVANRQTSNNNCVKCWMTKYYENHEVELERKRNYYYLTKEARRAYDKEYHRKHKAKINNRKRNRLSERAKEDETLLLRRHLKQRFNIMLDDYLRLLDKQNYRCAICDFKFENVNSNRDTRVDHDHKTGKIRGILCLHCNIGLGHFNDSIVELSNAVQYLKENS